MSRVLHPARHIISHFGDESFQEFKQSLALVLTTQKKIKYTKLTKSLKK